MPLNTYPVYLESHPYEIGAGRKYATITEAITAATAAGDTYADLVLYDSMTEDVNLPEGMTLRSTVQTTTIPITITGSFTATAGTGTATVVGLQFVGSGTNATISTIGANNLTLKNCILSNSGDLPVIKSDHACNYSFYDCTVICTAATAPLMDINAGNVSVVNWSNFNPTSGIVADISAGTLTAGYSSLLGQVVTSGTGAFAFSNMTCSVASGSCIDHDGSTAGTLINVSLSGTTAGDVLSGSGTINYSDIRIINNANTIESTLTFTPYSTKSIFMGNHLSEVQSAVAGSFTVTLRDSNKVYFNSNTAETTLPSIATCSVGTKYTFICNNASYIKINCNGTDTASYLTDTTAAGGYFRSNTVGSKLTVNKLAGTNWIVTDLDGTWTWDV